MADQEQEQYVWVRRQIGGLRAKIKLAELEGPHWDSISGGVQAVAPQPFIHGYMWCDRILEGELNHSCSHGPTPHRIKVCVTKTDNLAEVFDQLLAITGPRPHEEFSPSRRRLTTAYHEAGHAAEVAYHRGRNNWVGSEHDRQSALSLAQYATGGEEELQAYLKWLWVRAKNEVQTPPYRAAIEALAPVIAGRRRRILYDEAATVTVRQLPRLQGHPCSLGLGGSYSREIHMISTDQWAEIPPAMLAKLGERLDQRAKAASAA